jgi:tripartite-type tricarboxylate transporter receptor subunit TctC
MRGILAAALGVIVATTAVHGQDAARDAWPQRQVTIVVPFAVGGSADLLARILQQQLQKQLQPRITVPIVVENRSGAGGSLAAAYVAKAPADGYTLLLGTASTNAINAFLYSNLSFDVERDFRAISLLARFPNLLFVNPKLPVRTVPEVIAYLKASEGKVNYGSSGVGTTSHLSVEMFARAIGTHMTHIPFRSTADEIDNMIGGHIDLAIDSMTSAWPIAQSGAVRAIAVSTPQRVAAAPDLPTIGETLPGYEATAWQGLFAPAGTQRATIERISAVVNDAWRSPDLAASLQSLGAEPASSTPDEFGAYTRSERARWGAVVKAVGVKLD